MNCATAGLRRVARRWPALRRKRKWWFRPVYELLLLAIHVLTLAWLVAPDGRRGRYIRD